VIHIIGLTKFHHGFFGIRTGISYRIFENRSGQTFVAGNQNNFNNQPIVTLSYKKID
jgi:hypothetical protein